MTQVEVVEWNRQLNKGPQSSRPSPPKLPRLANARPRLVNELRLGDRSVQYCKTKLGSPNNNDDDTNANNNDDNDNDDDDGNDDHNNNNDTGNNNCEPSSELPSDHVVQPMENTSVNTVGTVKSCDQ